jgi:hypothetical protein
MGFSSNELNAGTACPLRSTKYVVTITDTCGLTSSDTLQVIIKNETGIKQVNPSLISTYTTGTLNFKGLPANSGLTIYNLLGQQLYQSTNYQNNYPVKTLPASMYFYRLTTTDGIEYKGKFEVLR